MDFPGCPPPPLIRDFRVAASLQYGYLRVGSPPLLCMIYGRSYHKSGYWNFNIRYNRPPRSTLATTTTAILSRLTRSSGSDFTHRTSFRLLSESRSANDLVASNVYLYALYFNFENQ